MLSFLEYRTEDTIELEELDRRCNRLDRIHPTVEQGRTSD